MLVCMTSHVNDLENKRQSRMDNPETLATLGTQDTGQSRNTGDIEYTRHRTIQKHWQHWAHKTQDNPETLATCGTPDTGQSRNTGDIGHTRHRTKSNNPETLATLGTQDTERSQKQHTHNSTMYILERIPDCNKYFKYTFESSIQQIFS